jgi:hypothetical protein
VSIRDVLIGEGLLVPKEIVVAMAELDDAPGVLRLDDAARAHAARVHGTWVDRPTRPGRRGGEGVQS